MGEMADFALEQVITNEDLLLDYKMGNMSTQDAYDNGFIDELGCEIFSSRSINCRCCGVTGLHWVNTENKWLLFDKSGIHKCTANPYIDE